MVEKSIIKRVLGLFPSPELPFILIGMSVSFVLFFLQPVLLNPERTMKFPVYVPAEEVVGVDLNHVLSYCAAWFIENKSPYIGLNLYPPFTILFFAPLMFMGSSAAYALVTTLTIAAYLLTALFLPKLILGNKAEFSAILLFFLTGLFSYGLQFEIERGQFNLIAFAFSMLAVFLYHNKPGARLFAYILLTVSVQLKVYPAIFILMFIDDWLDWKSNLKKVSGFVLVNFALFFALGYRVFLDFINAIHKQALTPEVSIINHSITSFSEIFFRKIGFRDLLMGWGMDRNQLRLLGEYSFAMEIALFIYVALCLIIIVSSAISLRSTSLNSRLLLACTVCSLLIPSVSLDYKLPLLAGPMVIFIEENASSAGSGKQTALSIFIILIGSFVYSIMLFSYTNKPLLLINNLPPLLMILTLAAIAAWFNRPEDRKEPLLE